MRTLNRKLARDLWGNRGQIVTIALVVAAGLTSLIAMYSTFRSLDGSTRAYYDRYRFGEVFAQARRVPESVATRAGQTPGVQTAYPRIVEWGFVPVEGMPEPAQAQIVSLPRHGEPPLNHIYLRRGRYPEPHRTDEVVVLESFADAHGFEPGDTLPLIMGGTFHRVRIVGIGLSPEFVFFGSRAEVVTDPARAVVIWMSRSAVSAAFQMEGAFNDLVISLQPRANEEAVISAIDRLLQP